MTDYLLDWPMLASALDEMRLPTDSERLEQIVQAVVNGVKELKTLTDEEAYDELTESWRLWVEGGNPSRVLKSCVRKALSVMPELNKLKNNYFACVQKLEESYCLTRPQAIEVLENAPLISTLRNSSNLSFGRISSVVGLDQYPWNVVETVAINMGLPGAKASFTPQDIEEILRSDLEFANNFYGDDTEEEAISTLAIALGKLGVNADIAQDLARIFDIAFDPHRVILHYELSVVEKFDKLPGDVIYEFAPRGKALERLWKEYEDTTQEPYLDNAKSDYSLDWSWAKSKYNRINRSIGDGPYRMMTIFGVLGALAYPTRKHVARLLRSLMVRHQVLTLETPEQIPAPSTAQANNFLRTVMKSNTATRGLFEQRACDYAVSILNLDGNYRISGIGSSINETNLSTLKFGDIECINVEARHIIAFEPHGGGISDVYVDAHLNTLYKVLPLRLEKLEAAYGPGKWTLEILFLSHDCSRLSSHWDGEKENLQDIDIELHFKLFFEYLNEAICDTSDEKATLTFKTVVTDRLSILPNSSYLRSAYAVAIAS